MALSLVASWHAQTEATRVTNTDLEVLYLSQPLPAMEADKHSALLCRLKHQQEAAELVAAPVMGVHLRLAVNVCFAPTDVHQCC